MLSSSRRYVRGTSLLLSAGITPHKIPLQLRQQQRGVAGLIFGGLVIATGAAVGHYVARAIRRVKEREAAERAQRASGGGDTESANASPLFNGDVLSLDIGSSSAKIAYLDSTNKVTVLENREGRHATPSAYQFDADSNAIIVGQVGKTQRYMKPNAVAFALHQLVGLTSDNNITKQLLREVPFQFKDIEGMVGVELRGNPFTATQLAEAVAKDMFLVAQGKLGSMDGVLGAITVPNFFNLAQRTEYLKACKAAGFTLTLDPAALPTDATAAVSGALDEGLITAAGDVAVIDIGGRHTQISIVEAKTDGSHQHVLKSHQTTFDVGSDLIDALIVKKLAEDFQKSQKLEILNDGMAVQRLFDAAESSKIELSRTPTSDVNLPFITADATGPKHLAASLSRAQLDALIEDMLSKLEVPVREAVKQAKITSPKDVKMVLLVGGGARTLKVQDSVAKLFGRSVEECLCSECPEELVAKGAAVLKYAQSTTNNS